ncbi:hypothetical protein C6501_13940 [Candidatus Poribacteria bacterium]|nr:MAG: hypothetical protein C6501_13940 [Candidatus Poribacteria bacterium]
MPGTATVAAEAKLKAKEIVVAAVEAHGGLEKLKAVKNVVADMQTTTHTPMGPMDLQVALYQVYPEKMRQNIVTPQGEISVVFDGEAAFVMSVAGMQPLPPEMTTSLTDAAFRDTVPLLVHLSQNDVPVQYAGTEEVDGKPTSALLVKQPSGEIVKIFISEETHYIIKLAFRETEQGATMDKETFFSDFREVEGVQFAFHVRQNVNGELYTDNRVSNIKLNTELDESLFEVPE